MSSIIRKTLILLLTLCMLFAALPITASAESYTGTCGENLTYSFDAATGILTVSGTGAMDDYSRKAAPWYAYRWNIETAVISEGVTTIGSGAFENCTVMTEIVIPDTVTYIGKKALKGCIFLTDVSFLGCREQWNKVTVDNNNGILWFTRYTFNPSFGGLLGDVDLNGSVNTCDLTDFSRHVSGTKGLPKAGLAVADVDRDGLVGAADMTKLARVLSRIDRIA